MQKKGPVCSGCIDLLTEEMKDQFVLPELGYSQKYKQLQFCSEECKNERVRICESLELDANVYFQEYSDFKRDELVKQLSAARFKRAKPARMTTCFLCRISFNENLFAPEEKYRECGSLLCSSKCAKAKDDVLGLPKAGVPRKKSSDHQKVETLQQQTATSSSITHGGLTLKVFDENRQLFEEIQRAQSSIPPPTASDPAVPPPSFGGYPPAGPPPGFPPGMPGFPPLGFPPAFPPGIPPPTGIAPPQESEYRKSLREKRSRSRSRSRERDRRRSRRSSRSRSRSRDRRRRRSRSRSRDRRSRRSRSRSRKRSKRSRTPERRSSDISTTKALVPVPAIDPIYDNYDVPLTMDDNDDRQNLSLRGQISELERVIQLKDEQIRMKEERAAIKEQQIEELKVEMAAQYESDGKKIAELEARIKELCAAEKLLVDDPEKLSGGEKLTVIQDLRAKTKQIRELEEKIETFKRRETQFRETVDAWKDEVEFVRQEYEQKCAELSSKLEEAEKKRQNFTKTMEIATEASSHHLKTQITDLEERLRLTNENNDLLRKQLLDRTAAPAHNGPHSGPRGPSYPYTGAPVFPGLSTLPQFPPTPAQPPSGPAGIFNQPPPPLPGTVVVPKSGHRPAKVVNKNSAPIDLTEDAPAQKTPPKREYSESQSNKRKEKLLIRLLKRSFTEGKTFAPEKGGGLESVWIERGFDKEPPTQEEIMGGVLPDRRVRKTSGVTMPSRTKPMDPNLGVIDDSKKPKPMGGGGNSPAASGIIYGANSNQGYAQAASQNDWSKDVQF